MKRVRTRLWAVTLCTTLGAAVLGSVGAPAQALSDPAIPRLTLDHTITTQPWTGSTGSANKAFDLEGSAYVPDDNSLWISDDNGDRIFEVDPDTGTLKRKLVGTDFQGISQLGVPATLSDATRTDDFESIAYDGTNDVLYIFSGNCCGTAPYNPTAFRLTRDGGGDFQVESWQPLDQGQDPTGAGYRPGVGLYYGHGTKIKTYDYVTNVAGSEITVKDANGASLPAVSIDGITFVDNATMFVSTSSAADPTLDRIMKINTSDWRAAPNWSFNLRNVVPSNGPQDLRSVEIIGDTFYVLDGYDGYLSSDTNRYRVWVYSLDSAPAPTANFTAIPTTGKVPMNVAFTDTSTGNPTSWVWDFDDGTSNSTAQNPSHTFTAVGTFDVQLTATNAAGSTSKTLSVTVNPATNLVGGYTLDGFGGIHRFRVGTGPLPGATSGGGYWNGWDIARGLAVYPTPNRGGYMLDGFGGIHRFKIGSGTNPPAVGAGAPYWNGWDIARGVAVTPNGRAAYLVDGFGGIHAIGLGTNPKPTAAIGGKYWAGLDMARGITIAANGKGGYVVDKTGKLWSFKLGASGIRPSAANSVFITTTKSVQGVALIDAGTGGFTVDGNGGIHRFGVGTNQKPPATSGAATWPTWDIARDIATLPEPPT